MAVVFSDDFNRANNDSLGGNWVESSGDVDISSNALLCTGTAIVKNTTAVGQADYEVTMDFDWSQNSSSEWIIPIIRADTGEASPYTTCYAGYFQGSTGTEFHLILRRLSGSQSQLGSTNNDPYTGVHKVGIRAEGTSISTVIDDVATITASDSNITAEGNHGFRIDTDCVIDNYIVDDLAPAGSPSSSVSPSVSPSASKSPSASQSPSSSPSPGWEGYTRGDEASLPGDDADLETDYTSQDYLDVDADDGDRVGITTTGEFMIHQFKDYVGSAPSCQLNWNGQSTLAASLSTVYLQIYNRDTPAWETVDSNSAAAYDTDFDLTAYIADLTDYVDSNGVISCRVYQDCL